MATLQNLSLLALRQLIVGACKSIGLVAAGEITDKVVQFLTRRFSDHSQRLVKALEESNERAWQTLEISLAGASFWNRCRLVFAAKEEQAFRQQVQGLLDATTQAGLSIHPPEFRQECLRQLREARKAGALTGSLDMPALVRQAGEFARFADPGRLFDAERQVIQQTAADLTKAGYSSLAYYASLETAVGMTLLASAVRYFFRRHVETDRELFQGLTFAQLEQVEQAQEAGFAALADLFSQHGDRLEELVGDVRDVVVETHGDVLSIKAELERQGQQLQELGRAVLRALDQNRLPERDLRPGDSMSIGSEGERQRVRSLMARFRSLSEPERSRLPALLNGLGLLEAAAGDFDAAQRDFREVARLVDDPVARAAAQHNAYLAALEQRQWEHALSALHEAVALAPERFAPFPTSKYEALRILGAGGFGVAFLCKHRNTGSQVVVKSIRIDGLDRDVGEVFREAQVLEELDHPAIIRLRDCDFADAGRTRPFLVMEHFEGLTLADHVDRHGPLSAADLTAVAQTVAEALQAAHERGILHRDIKPANLLVRKDADRWRVKLIDFGLAMKRSVLRESLSGPHTLIGYSVAGTRDFAAPEQMGLLPGVAASPASDIYGFARTCCYALFKTVHPLRKHWNDVPGTLADLLEQCLAESPAERLNSFSQILDKLGGGQTRPIPIPQAVTHVGRVDAIPGAPPPRAATPPMPIAPAAKPVTRAPGQKAGEIHRFTDHTGAITCVAFSADGRLAASGGRDGTVLLWDVQSRKASHSCMGHTKPVGNVVFSRNGHLLISSSADHSVRIFQVHTGCEFRRFESRANWSVALSPDDYRALSGGVQDGSLRLWEIERGEDLRQFQGHTDLVRGIAFAPDGRHALSSSRDQTVRLWDVNSGQQLQCFTVPKVWLTTICFTPDGRHALTGHGQAVSLWDLKSGREAARLVGHADDVLAAAVSPDGRRVVSGSVDQTVRVWDLQSAKELACFVGHVGEVAAVALTADGQFALSGGEDRTVRYWRLPD